MTPPKAKPAGPTCHMCKTALRGAKIVIDGLWTCSDCVYALEYGVAPPASRPPRRRRLHPQEERLFPLPPPIARKRKRVQRGPDEAPVADALIPGNDSVDGTDIEVTRKRASDS
jgi:hypothetical protein